MSQIRTYLDYNATAPLRAEARAAMIDALHLFGNPSSVHAEGRRARTIVEDARDRVASLLGASPAEIVFTSGGSEANAGVLTAGWDAILLSGVEHASVRGPAEASGARLINVPVNENGEIDVAHVTVALAEVGRGRHLLSLQLANNETGVVQPVARVAALARAHGVAVLTDAVQAAGRLPIDFAGLGVDYLTVSGHKLGAPKGVGAVVVRDAASPPNLVHGGGQERGRRGGTENVPAIAGFGAAAAIAAAELDRVSRTRELRDRLEREALALVPDASIIGDGAERLCNTTCVAVPGQRAELLLIKLDLAGIAVSAGAACSSGKVGRSHVLEAMRLAPETRDAAIRISLGWASSEADVDAFINVWRHIMCTAPRLQAA